MRSKDEESKRFFLEKKKQKTLVWLEGDSPAKVLLLLFFQEKKAFLPLSGVTLQGVSKHFGRHVVLSRVDLEIADGEFCVFVGPSGCGKSTLLRLIAGLEEVSAGEIHIGGQRVTHLPPAKRGIAMVFQSYALYPHMTVYQNMAFGLSIGRAGKAEIDVRVRRAADILRIAPLLERLPRELSGGQRQRVAIGRAIVRKPGVFLFDEPLSNLDAALRVQTRLELAKLHAGLDASMIYVTHDQVEAMTLADKIVLLHAGAAIERQGSIAQVGAPLELYHHPVNLFVAGFIGSPAMNLLAGTLVEAGAGRGVIRLPDGARLAADVDAHLGIPGQSATLGIRPENVRRGGNAGDPGVLTLTVSHVEHVGDASYLYLDDGAFTLREDAATAVRAGDRLTVHLPPEHCHLFDAAGSAFPRKARGSASELRWGPRLQTP